MIETQTDKPSLTITLPSWVLAVAKIVDYAASTAAEGAKSAVEGIKVAEDKVEEKVKQNPFKKVKLPKVKINTSGIVNSVKKLLAKNKKASVIIAAVLVIGIFAILKVNSLKNKSFVRGASEQTVVNNGPSVNINKTFDVPIKTSDGKEVGESLKVTITTIEETDQILVQSKPATAKNGKTFLLVNMEIENSTKKELTVKPVDMVRLVDSQGRNFAPDVYNTDVAAEAVSLKKTRVGYVVDKSQKSFKMLIGEVRGKQDPIEVNF